MNKSFTINKEYIISFFVFALSSNNIKLEIESINITLFMFLIGLFSIFTRIRKIETLIDVFVILFVGYALTRTDFNYSMQFIKLGLYLIINIYIFFATKFIVRKYGNLNWYKILDTSGSWLCIVSLLYYSYSLFVAKFNYSEAYTLGGVMIDRYIPRLIGIADIDPNYACIIFIFYFLFSICNTKYKVNIKLLLLSLSCIILTFSRGGWLAILISSFIYMIFNAKRLKSMAVFKNIILAVLFISVMIIICLSSNDSFLKRRIDNAYASGGSGRLRIWQNYIILFKENHFGYGLNTSRFIASQKFGDGHKAHNTILSIAVELGIVGLIIYLLLFLLALIASYSFKCKFLFLFLISYFICTLFLSTIEMPLFYVLIGSISSLLGKNKRKEVNIE